MQPFDQDPSIGGDPALHATVRTRKPIPPSGTMTRISGGVAKQSMGLELKLEVSPEVFEQMRRHGIEISFGPLTVHHHAIPHVATPPVSSPIRISDARAGRTTGTIQDHFFALMRRGALLQQSDYRLAARGLLIPEGGLCATTSAVNVLHAAFSHLGRDTSVFASADRLVERLVDRVWQSFSSDARMGTDFDKLKHVIDHVANELHPEVGVNAERDYVWRTNTGPDFTRLMGDGETLSLLRVTTSETSGHALAVLDIDVFRRTITYSDPNFPNQAIQRRFTAGLDGALRIDGFGRFGEVTDVLRIRTQNFDEKPYRRWANFDGKRAWITSTEGHRYVTSIDRIEGPSHEHPKGRVIAYSYLFGGGGGGGTSLDSVASIEPVEPPTKSELAKYQKLVGRKVRVEFTEACWNQRYGGETFRLEEVTREVDREKHPFGGLKLVAVKEFGTSGVVPFDVVASIRAV